MVKQIKLIYFTAFYLFLLTIASYNAHSQSTSIFLEGTATIAAHQSFFMENFIMEAEGFGISFEDNKENAGYTFRFEVEPFDPDQYIIRVNLYSNEDNTRLIFLSRFFTRLEDSYEFNQFLLFQSIIYIPSIQKALRGEIESVEQSNIIIEEAAEEIIEEKTEEIYEETTEESTEESMEEDNVITAIQTPERTEAAETPAENETSSNRRERDDNWRNMSIYIRASADYNILPTTNDSNFFGATAGVEFRRSGQLSFEPLIKLHLEGPDYAVAMAVGAGFKYPIKLIPYILLEPYGALLYSLTDSINSTANHFSAGLGFHISIRGGNRSAFFVDLNYFTNFYLDFSNITITSSSPYITEFFYQKPHVFGIGIGYKLGFF